MQAGDYYVTASALWLRDAPSTSGNQVALMPAGAVVHADGKENNGFASISFGQVLGWAAIPYLASVSNGTPNPSPNPQPAATPDQIKASSQLLITGQDVALRSDSQISNPAFGSGSNVIVTTNKGEVVANQGAQQNGFCSVTYKGQPGWMSLLYLAPTDLSPTSGAIVKAPETPNPVIELDDASTSSPPVQTEIGKVGGGVAAIGLLALAVGIYFLAK
jgi:uncharacterized protein YgiM (DUF1202 family)